MLDCRKIKIEDDWPLISLQHWYYVDMPSNLVVTKVCQAKNNAKVLSLHGLKQQIQSFDYVTQKDL